MIWMERYLLFICSRRAVFWRILMVIKCYMVMHPDAWDRCLLNFVPCILENYQAGKLKNAGYILSLWSYPATKAVDIVLSSNTTLITGLLAKRRCGRVSARENHNDLFFPSRLITWCMSTCQLYHQYGFRSYRIFWAGRYWWSHCLNFSKGPSKWYLHSAIYERRQSSCRNANL